MSEPAYNAYLRALNDGEIDDSLAARRAFFTGWDSLHTYREDTKAAREAGGDHRVMGVLLAVVGGMLCLAVIFVRFTNPAVLIPERGIGGAVIGSLLLFFGIRLLFQASKISLAAQRIYRQRWS